MQTETLLIALVVAVIGPVILSYLNGLQRRKEKEQDYARQDEVAAKVVEAAKKVAKTAKTSDKKLDEIHILVNSNMTAAMQAELDARIGQLLLMKEVIELKKALGKTPLKDALVAVESTEEKITELRTKLADRLRQTKLAEKQVESA